MKQLLRLTLLGLCMFILNTTFAQVPEGINYQAAVRDNNGNPLASTNVDVRVSIKNGNTTEYQESFTVTTNDYGLFNVVIGKGNILVGVFGDLDWSNTHFSFEIEVNDGGGYQSLGTYPFQTVPYAFAAGNTEHMHSVGQLSNTDTTGVAVDDVLQWDGTDWVPAQFPTQTTYAAGTGLTLIGTTFNADSNKAIWNSGYLNGTPVSSAAPVTNDVLKFDGTRWKAVANTGGTNYFGGMGITLSGTTIHADSGSAIWNASFLHGRTISSSSPGTNDVLTWDGSKWEPSAAQKNTYTSGPGVTISSNVVMADSNRAIWNALSLRGRTVASTTPSSNDVLTWNGTNWSPASAQGNTYTGGNGITVSGTTVHADSNNAIWNALSLRGRTVASTAPSNNDVLKWNGSNWAPGTVSGGGGSVWSQSGDTAFYMIGNVGIGEKSPWTRFMIQDDSLNGTTRGRAFQVHGRKIGTSGSAVGNMWSQLVGNHDGPTRAIEAQADSGYWIQAFAGFAEGGLTSTTGMFARAEGIDTAHHIGVRGYGDGSSTENTGVKGEAYGTNTNDYWQYGVHGVSDLSAGGLYGRGILGEAIGEGQSGNTQNTGVRGYAADNADENIGVWGATSGTASDNFGVVAQSYGSHFGTNYGIYASASNASTDYAGYFSGDVYIDGDLDVSGWLSKSFGSFKIDHPTSPEDKYLIHSFVESPDMMNVYNGNITTDANGNATVTLPEYFEASNKDFKYQLTVIGQFAQAIIGEKISGNNFVIRTDKPNVEVSWQITGVRADPFAEANRIEPEMAKEADKQGLYIHPELYGQPEEKGMNFKHKGPKQVDTRTKATGPLPKGQSSRTPANLTDKNPTK